MFSQQDAVFYICIISITVLHLLRLAELLLMFTLRCFRFLRTDARFRRLHCLVHFHESFYFIRLPPTQDVQLLSLSVLFQTLVALPKTYYDWIMLTRFLNQKYKVLGTFLPITLVFNEFKIHF